MLTHIAVSTLATEADWATLKSTLGAGRENFLLASVLNDLKAAGALGAVFESAYIDRDFSAAYSAFYSTVFQPYLKYCSRLHFFNVDVTDVSAAGDAEAISRTLEEHDEHYLGYIVLRPLAHAPISSTVLSATHLRGSPNQEVAVRSSFQVHALGATLNVEGAPLTQQDTRIGACAQATIWTAARHFHNRHSGAWYSIPDITEAALKPTDSALTR